MSKGDNSIEKAAERASEKIKKNGFAQRDRRERHDEEALEVAKKSPGP